MKKSVLLLFLFVATTLSAQHLGNKLIVQSVDTMPFTLIVSGYKVNKAPAVSVSQSDIYMDEVKIKVIWADSTYQPVVAEVALAKTYTKKQLKKAAKAGALNPVPAPTTAIYKVYAKKKKSKIELVKITSKY